MRIQPHRGSFLQGFFPQFTLFIFIPLIVLVLLIALVGMNLHQQAMRDLATQQDLRALRLIANTLSEQVNRRQVALQALGDQFGPGVDPKEVLASDSTLSDLFDGGVALYDRKTTLLASTPEYTLDQADRSDIQLLLATLPDQAQTPINLAPNPLAIPNRSPFLVLVGRLTPSLEIVGAYSLNQLARAAIAPAFSPAEAAVYLLDSSGKVLYQNNQAATQDLAIHSIVSEISSNQEGLSLDPTINGNQAISYIPVPGLGWNLVVEDLGQTLADPYLSSSLNAPLALIPLIFFALVALIFGISQVTGPLRKLQLQAITPTSGKTSNFQKRVGGITEIRNLQSSLVQVDEQIQADRANLQQYLQATTAGLADRRLTLALQDLVANSSPSSGTHMRFDSNGSPLALPIEWELLLYSAAQVALENVIQHSRAANAWVRLVYGDGATRLEIQDDGQGFILPKSPSVFVKAGHFGLARLASQASENGASLEIITNPGQGTLIRLSTPETQNASEKTITGTNSING